MLGLQLLHNIVASLGLITEKRKVGVYLLPPFELKRKCAERHGACVHRLTPLLLQAWNKALTDTSSWSELGVGTGCLGQSPPDL